MLLNALPPSLISYALTTNNYPIFDSYVTYALLNGVSQTESCIVMGAIVLYAQP